MKLNYKLITILTITIKTTFLYSQSYVGMPHTPGKYYAKCLIPDVYEYWEESYQIYSGTYYDSLNFVEKIDISLDGEDVYNIYVVTDSTLTNEFVWETFLFEEVVED